MIIPESRFKKQKKKKFKIIPIIIVLGIFILLSIAYLTIYKNKEKNVGTDPKVIHTQDKTLKELWIDNKYRDLNEKCEGILLLRPLDAEALIYNGFAYFQLGIAQFTLEDQLPLLDLSITNLRKADLLKSHPLSGKVNYVLGKAYYHKGRFYMDEAINYMEKSISLGFLNDDSYKYLGLSYSELGFYKKGIEYFLKAIKDKNDDMLLLVIGQTYHKLGDTVNSELYLKSAIEINDDFRVEIKSRFLLGKLYFENGEFTKAEEQYDLILAKDTKSADAHYFKGEIYSELGNTVKARAEWRKTLGIDPSHYGALLRLYPTN